jgi:hypothetical protein
MTELFSNISEEIRQNAANTWELATTMSAVNAANFLNIYTNIFSLSHTEEETDFLRFYFNLQMEMMKE